MIKEDKFILYIIFYINIKYIKRIRINLDKGMGMISRKVVVEKMSN